MATDNSIGGIYLRLGLSLSELETGFVTASRTVAANVSRLNREANLIRLRTEVEIAGLDEATDGERILQLRTQSLNQQMQIQRDRIRILNAELQELTRTHGENATATQRATIRLERERLALANLERDLRNLNSSSNSTGSLDELSDLLPSMPTKLQAIGIAFGAVTSGIGAATAATKALLDEFHELQNQSYELNMSFSDTRNFLREMKLAGGDIGDIEGYIRGITDAFVKGEWDDPEFIALRKYGAEITDATGRLKDFKGITEEVYQAWKKANEAGEGIEFLQLTGGEMGVRDIIQYFQRLEEAREDAAKIFKAEIDDKQLHELDRTLNLVTAQADELQAAIGGIFTPAVQLAGEKFFQMLRDGTEYIEENKDGIQRWGFTVAEAFDTIGDKIGAGVDKLAEFAKAQKGTTGNAKADKMMSGMGWRYQEFNQQTPWQKGNEPWKNFPDPKSNGILDDFYKRRDERQQAYIDEFRKEVEKTDKALADNNPLNQYAQKRIQDFKDELEDLKIEIEFDDNSYQKALAQLDLWKKRELDYKNFVSDEERSAIEELYAAKLEQIEKERSDKIKQYWKDAADIEYSLTHTAFEKQIRDIEQWKDAQLEKTQLIKDQAKAAEEAAAVTAQAAAKEAQAFEDAMDRIKGKLQSLDDKIFSKEHSQYEQDLRRIQQERIRYYEDFQKEGVLNPDTVARIERWYSNAVNDLNKKAAKGGDYTKAPEGAMQRGGNGITVIGADQIFDDGKINQSIGLIADESRERALLSQGLSKETRERIAAIESAKQLNDAQKILAEQTRQASSGFQLIEGDKFSNLPTQAALPQPQADVQQISGEEIIPTQELQQFGDTIQQTNSELENFNPASAFADANKSLAESAKALPPDYFKNLADGTKAVSEMQLRLTESTMKLIDAQGKLITALSNMPDFKQTNSQQPTEGFQQLATSTKDVSDAQDLLARTTRQTDSRLKAISDIPQPVKQDSGFKFGIDYDTFKDVLLTGIGIAAPAAMTGVGAVGAPVILGGTALAALTAAIAKGSYDETTAAKDYPDVDLSGLAAQLSGIDEKLQSVIQDKQSDEMPEINFSELMTPLNNLDTPLSGILQQMQDSQPQQEDRLQELFGTLPNIEADLKSVLLELQSRAELPDNNVEMPSQSAIDYLTPINNIDAKAQAILQEIQAQASRETTISFDTVVAPLDNIASVVQNILTALSDRQPPSVTVSPSVDIDLGGAYVFDEAMKSSLVNDITNRVVSEIKNAVQQATSQSNYGYSA